MTTEFIYWLNVDSPTSVAVLHHAGRCRHTQDIGETPLKGVRVLKQDGGWMPFETRQDAENYVRDLRRSLRLRECAICRGSD